MTINVRYKKVIDWFRENVPVAESELRYDNPYQLVVAVILSAQCTDKRVNMTTPAIYHRYPTVDDLALATHEELFELIKSISYPNNKTKNIIAMAKKVVSDFESTIPESIEELQTLPGVGRKTANVVASVAFAKPAIAVDTHVFRVANRIGLAVDAKTPLEVEKQLMLHIPKDLWAIAHHWLILHGRYVCTARNPKCEACGIKEYCKWASRNTVQETKSRIKEKTQ